MNETITLEHHREPTYWSLDVAVAAIRDLNPKLAKVGYCVALTGGVLFKGESNKDLDLVLFPLKGNDTPYQPALQVTRKHFAAKTLYGVDFDGLQSGKAIFIINHSAGQRVDIFIPHVTTDERDDNLNDLHETYANI